MRKKSLLVLLCALLLTLAVPVRTVRADAKLNFISINDQLPAELINCVAIQGGVIYVPYNLFSNYHMGISYSYFTSASTAYLYTVDKQLFFELNGGDTYDGLDNHYAGSALWHGGTVYVPLNLIQKFFGGFEFSYYSANEYGNILRINTGAASLSDEEFQRAARDAMRTYYLASLMPDPLITPAPDASSSPSASAPVPSPAVTLQPRPEATPAPTPEPPARPGETPPPLHAGERLVLGFAGLPADRLLNLLAQTGIHSCFFLTAEDIRANPDLVRRIAGEGHALGVLCADTEAEAETDAPDALRGAAALLFEAAHVRTLLAAAAPGRAADCREAAEAEGMVYCGSLFVPAPDSGQADSPAALLEAAKTALGASPLLLDCGADNTLFLVQFLRYVSAQRYAVVRPLETDRFALRADAGPADTPGGGERSDGMEAYGGMEAYDGNEAHGGNEAG